MTDDEWTTAQAKLITDCPVFFRDGDFYFEIPRGWHGPVRKACLALERIAEEDEAPADPYEDPDPRPRAAQIKEKLGGLRLYIDGHSRESDNIVEAAEEECYKLCQVCGEEGSMRDERGWLSTLCSLHSEEAG